MLRDWNRNVIFPPTACGGLVERLPVNQGLLMKRWLGRVISLVLLVVALPAAAEETPDSARLVFGSFKSVQNATNWASRLSLRLNASIVTQSYQQSDGVWYRVVSERLQPEALSQLSRAAESQQLRFWRLLDDGLEIAGPVDPQAPPPVAAPAVRSQEALRHPVREVTESRSDSTVQMFDIDLGMQSRTFFQSGLDGQSKFANRACQVARLHSFHATLVMSVGLAFIHRRIAADRVDWLRVSNA